MIQRLFVGYFAATLIIGLGAPVAMISYGMGGLPSTLLAGPKRTFLLIILGLMVVEFLMMPLMRERLTVKTETETEAEPVALSIVLHSFAFAPVIYLLLLVYLARATPPAESIDWLIVAVVLSSLAGHYYTKGAAVQYDRVKNPPQGPSLGLR